ncbi:MAG: Verru_Chthon cassette protein A [Terrimicrobiaceae bacterium]|nr:Verru_Chthon cassette protein A [Terrimicrobiaceae bacterium]
MTKIPPTTLRTRPRAFALVLVLIVLVLVTSMAVLFLASAGRERRGVELYARDGEVRHLASLAVNRVIGQISTATREGTASDPVAWASQPGMVRTYDASGAAANVYKLYSWDNFVEPAAGFNPADSAQMPPAGWPSRPAEFVDLNQPINGIHPIVDPAAIGEVEGFSIDDSAAAVSGSGSEAPMPVRWLYVLQDGRLAAPTAGNPNSPTIPGASSNNPIVGRVAFWTDDETSKVNVNTASEGAFWDSPKSASRDEMQFAANPPVKNEFQRTPGHPAMTSLSAVFGELLNEDSSDPTRTRWADTAEFRREIQSIFNLTPRVHVGGSLGGTAPVNSYTTDYSLAALPNLPTRITPDSDRLYATADDFWFAPARSSQAAFDALGGDEKERVNRFQQRLFFLTAASRAPETTLFETPRVSLWPVTWPWPSSFFRPWKDSNTFRGRNSGALPTTVAPSQPISQNPWMTSEERLLAFCATLNIGAAQPNRYFFQRQNPDSPTHDWQEIERNQELVNYIRRSFDREIPAFGGRLADKWGARNADWIALNTFGFSRAMINQVAWNSIPSNPVQPGQNEVGYSFTGLAARDIWLNNTRRSQYIEPNAYTVAPLRTSVNGSDYTSVGAYPRLEEVAVMFYATARRLPVPPAASAPQRSTPENNYFNPFNWQYLINPGPAHGGSADYPIASQTTEMRAVMLFDFTALSSGVTSASPVFWIRVNGQPFRVNGNSIALPAGGGRSVQWNTFITRSTMVNPLFWPLFNKSGATSGARPDPKIFENSSSAANRWALISDPIPISPDSVTFEFAGTQITVDIYAPYSTNLETDPTSDPNQLVSTQTIDFSAWDGSLPVPIAPRWNVRDANASPPRNRPDPNVSSFVTPEARPTRWANIEIAPSLLNPLDTFAPDQIRDTTNLLPTRTIPYAYISNNGTLVSPVFENRVRSLNGRNQSIFTAENSGTDLSRAEIDTPLLEGVPIITPYDTVISMAADPTGPGGGDPRILESTPTFRRIDQIFGGQPDLVFKNTQPSPPGPFYPRATARAQFHALGTPGSAGPLSTGYRRTLQFGPSNISMATTGRFGWTASQLGAGTSLEGMVGGYFAGNNRVQPEWDWTMMPGNLPDGGLLWRPDQDYQTLFTDFSDSAFVGTPYFLRYQAYGSPGSGYFSPNRQVPSPVILGTLPSSRTTGWQTLAFSPIPAAGTSHPGLTTPRDHLVLDLFWMPIAEPYPISDQFSTAGKVNLNYAIVPFAYLERKTALHALLKSTWMSAIPDSAVTDYKSHFFFRQSNTRTRFAVDIPETLQDFDAKFASGDIFRSASQICEMFLVPVGQQLSGVKSSFWTTRRLTADNLREQPYDHLYSRVTTKSNTFTVHWRVQSLRKAPGSAPDVWEEGRDRTAAELRGSTLIERYIDPNATDIPDYATEPDAEPLSRFYRWRIVSENYFQP